MLKKFILIQEQS